MNNELNENLDLNRNESYKKIANITNIKDQ